MFNVQIVLFDGFDLLDALAPYEVFCAAEMFADCEMHVELVTAEGPRRVPSGMSGLPIEASGRLNPTRKGVILVPGASGKLEGEGPDAVPNLLARAADTELTAKLKQALGLSDVVVAAVCGGSLVLAMGGLLEGRPAVTHHLGMDVLGATGAVPVRARVVDDGNLITGGGITSGLDIALYLVDRELGPRIAHAVEQLFEYERRGTVWRNSGMALRQDQPQAADEEADLGHSATNNSVRSSIFDGEWDTSIATPIGKLAVRLLIETNNGVIRGTAAQGGEISPFIDPVIQGNRLTWSQQVTRPMRLNLIFEVTVNGDLMTGTAKAGILPASKLTGQRL